MVPTSKSQHASGTAWTNHQSFVRAVESQSFIIPVDYQHKVLDAMASITRVSAEDGMSQHVLEARLDRIKNLYRWCDMSQTDYLRERAEIQKQLDTMKPPPEQEQTLSALASLPTKVRSAWNAATQKERNQLARTLLESIRIDGDQAVGIKPRVAFTPFFRLNKEWWGSAKHPDDSAWVSTKGTRRGSDGLSLRRVDTTRPLRVEVADQRPQSLKPAVSTPSRHHAVRPDTILAVDGPSVAEVVRRSGLRTAADQFGVSHEAIRQSLRAHGVATDLASRHAERNQQVRELASQGLPWAKIADEVGLSTWRVRALCADLPKRKVGRPPRETE
jgi:hypothetical protein